MRNVDSLTVAGFGKEWARFDQAPLSEEERRRIFAAYFAVFPWHLVTNQAIGADIGCGSGRWAVLVAPRVGLLHCVDPSDAIDVAITTCRGHENVRFHRTDVDSLPFEDGSLDFAYSLGVLHHVPDTAGAIRTIVQKLKRGAPLQLYLYYAFDNRPTWFRALWRVSDAIRKVASRTPFGLRYFLTQVAAVVVYWPLARIARLLETFRLLPDAFPLAQYRDKSFYTMRTDALDRFGTRLEKRFSRSEISEMMSAAGLDHVVFSPRPPFWCCVGIKGSRG